MVYNHDGNIDTSKFDDAKPVYGSNGAFLYSLAAVALVSITSRHFSCCSYCTIHWHRSRVINRLVPAPPHQHLSAREHGTRVIVRDLFGNMPVRVHRRAMVFQGHEENNREWSHLKKSVVALLLAWGRPITVIAKDSDGNSKFLIRGPSAGSVIPDRSPGPERLCSFKAPFVRSILSQAAYISSFDWCSWVVTSARTIFMTARGAFSLQPAPSKHVQFISIGIRPIHTEGVGNELYDSINGIFASSSFGILEDKPEPDSLGMKHPTKDRHIGSNGLNNKGLKRGGKGVDRWPMFFVKIDLHGTEQSSSTIKDEVIENEQNLRTIIEVLTEMIAQFLKEHHFRLARTRSKRMPETTSRGSISSMSSRTTSSHSKASGNVTVISGIAEALRNPRSGTVSEFRSRSRPGSSCAAVPRDTNYHSHKSEHQDSCKDDHVGIPSLPHLQRNDNGYKFNSWTRMKAGKRDFVEDVCAGLPTTKGCEQRMRLPSKSDIEHELKEIGLPMLKALKASDHPASGRDGDVTGQASRFSPCVVPAETLEESLPECSTNGLLNAPEVEGNESAADATLLWTNPVSKATLAINSRTGMIIPRRTYRPLSAPSAVGMSGRSRGLCSSWRRKLSSTTSTRTDPRTSPKDSWLGRFLESWENPVFQQTEEAIPRAQMCETTGVAAQVSKGLEQYSLQSGIKGVVEHPITTLSGKLSKAALRNAEIVSQVDNKFILIKMEVQPTNHDSGESLHVKRRLLVLVDQHAADERCRIEGLMVDFCRPPASATELSSNLGYTSRIITTPLSKQITFLVPVREIDMFRLHAGHFAAWGILYDISDCQDGSARKELQSEHKIVIKSLPPAITERCKTEPAHLISLLRGEMWKREGKDRSARIISPKPSSHGKTPVKSSDTKQAEDGEPEEHTWLQRIGDCPEGILDMLNSRACRSAIMFNDQLTREQCQTLISTLAQCAFPFQCAHGRPSMIPLVGLGEFRPEQLQEAAIDAFGRHPIGREAEQPTFVEAFNKWKETRERLTF